jgi:hypothetical protein
LKLLSLVKNGSNCDLSHASNIVWQSPPIEGDVVAAIRYKRLQEYSDFIALFLREKHGPACGVQAVV